MADVASGIFAMFAGDGNSSAIVTAADANAVFGELNATGYTPNDINMSGIVTAADANMALGSLGESTQVP